MQFLDFYDQVNENLMFIYRNKVYGLDCRSLDVSTTFARVRRPGNIGHVSTYALIQGQSVHVDGITPRKVVERVNTILAASYLTPMDDGALLFEEDGRLRCAMIRDQRLKIFDYSTTN